MERIKELFQRGFFHILGSTVINKIIAFLANIAIVRILTKHDYGVFTGAFNVFFIVFLFSGMGIVNGILYYCSKDVPREEKKSFYAWAVRFGLWTEVLLSAAILIYGLFFNVGIEEMRVYILSLAPLPFLAFIFDYYSIILRAEKDNKRYSLYLNIHSALYAGLAILGGLCFGIAGTIAGRYLAYVIADVIGYYFCRDYADISWKGRPSPEARKDIRKYSLKAGITSALNVILYRIDVAVIALVVADASVLASYKTGAQLPENMNFIPQSLMVYFVPLFVQHLGNGEWIRKKTKEIYLAAAGVSFVLGTAVYALAPWIVQILWGEAYLDAVPCMRILTVSFVILSAFRITSTNILLSLKRAGYTMAVSIITGTVNIGLDVVLTMKYGSIGAAWATLIVTVLAAALSFPYVLYIVYSGKEKYE